MRAHFLSFGAVGFLFVVACGAGSIDGPATDASNGTSDGGDARASDGGDKSSQDGGDNRNGGDKGASCTDNAGCPSGYCVHEAGKPGDCGDGKVYCWADDQCASGRCNVKDASKISYCTDGEDKDPCTDGADCVSAKCIASAFGKVCSSGLAGAPCGTKDDCTAVGGICAYNYCSAAAGLGGQCYGSYVCQAGLSCVQFNFATYGACTDKKLGSPCSLANECVEGACVGASTVGLGKCQ